MKILWTSIRVRPSRSLIATLIWSSISTNSIGLLWIKSIWSVLPPKTVDGSSIVFSLWTRERMSWLDDGLNPFVARTIPSLIADVATRCTCISCPCFFVYRMNGVAWLSWTIWIILETTGLANCGACSAIASLKNRSDKTSCGLLRTIFEMLFVTRARSSFDIASRVLLTRNTASIFSSPAGSYLNTGISEFWTIHSVYSPILSDSSSARTIITPPSPIAFSAWRAT